MAELLLADENKPKIEGRSRFPPNASRILEHFKNNKEQNETFRAPTYDREGRGPEQS
jgi:hypothetical protein